MLSVEFEGLTLGTVIRDIVAEIPLLVPCDGSAVSVTVVIVILDDEALALLVVKTKSVPNEP